MDHVAEHHGLQVAADIEVRLMEDLNPFQGKVKLPKTPKEFHEFPENYGWSIGEDYQLEPQSRAKCDLAVFLQAWLFFGLVFSVVRTDEGPLLRFDQLVNDKFLSTIQLHAALKKWADWEGNQENRKGLRLRMIQTGLILDRARQVMRKNCASRNGEVWYASDQKSPLHILDEHVLVLMCLGEVLCEVKDKIMKDNKVSMSGWHPIDDREGWGPPRYIFNEMTREGWCPRAIRLLRVQFSSNATMLLSAYYAYRSSERMTAKHAEEGCTPEECRVKSKDKDGNYENKHICKDRSCQATGPDQKKILQVLATDDIPLLRFCDDDGDKILFEVIPFNRNSGAQLDYVTISHVWSDGWGNEDVNELNYCQLRFLQRQIEEVSGSPQTAFWMDTLVVPVGKTQEIRDAKKKAIKQIFDVFDASAHTIVVDNGLFAVNPGKKVAEPAMKVLSSVWMRRLWTLQEAYLSRSIHFTFKEGERGSRALMSFDQIEGKLQGSSNEPVAGITGLVRDHLSSIIMGEQRRDRNHNRNRQRTLFSKEEAAIVVANAWRAARWRVSIPLC
ncbi:hypothetical protein BX600DRAFT_274639 [Xylariales sp. PMI_506]|nr:hypothetical protein BX600DRAFT_274639 [Xylariales sp. PMI_506]